jgi:hypothetical protein
LLPGIGAGLGDVACIAFKALDDIAFIQTQGDGEPSVPAVEVHHQATCNTRLLNQLSGRDGRALGRQTRLRQKE